MTLVAQLLEEDVVRKMHIPFNFQEVNLHECLVVDEAMDRSE
jgi:hypothetical protein